MNTQRLISKDMITNHIQQSASKSNLPGLADLSITGFSADGRVVSTFFSAILFIESSAFSSSDKGAGFFFNMAKGSMPPNIETPPTGFLGFDGSAGLGESIT